MTANIEKLLLSDVKSGSASRWRQDGLFNFCYSLLFRYHITSPFSFVQWKCTHMLLSTVKGCFPTVPGLDTSHCSTAQTMSPPSTKNFVNLTNFYPNWSMVHLRKVSLFSLHLLFCLSSIWRHSFNRGIPSSQLIQETTVGAAVCWMAEPGVRANLLATELQPVPGAGGSRRGNAEASVTPAAVDHSGELISKTKILWLMPPHPSVVFQFLTRPVKMCKYLVWLCS